MRVGRGPGQPNARGLAWRRFDGRRSGVFGIEIAEIDSVLVHHAGWMEVDRGSLRLGEREGTGLASWTFAGFHYSVALAAVAGAATKKG